MDLRIQCLCIDTADPVVLADPDGNEFCLLRPLTPEELAEG